MGEQTFGIEQAACHKIAVALKQVADLNVQMALVVGGGNIFRGHQGEAFGFARTPADHIGMLATVINGIILYQSLEKLGVKCRVMSAFDTDTMVETYNWAHALQALEQGICTIFVGGTGNPYFTTDSAAALRASEIHAEVLFKGTKVAGVYDEDPVKNPKAKKYSHLTYEEVLLRKLNVMDATAIALCRENRIPICVFDLFESDIIYRAIMGESVGTLVSGDAK